jgi:plasmid stabilization system protein ParE
MKRFEVVVTSAARRDLRQLREWIAADNPDAAKRFVAALGEQIQRMETLPLRGGRRPPRATPLHEIPPYPLAHCLIGTWSTVIPVAIAS